MSNLEDIEVTLLESVPELKQRVETLERIVTDQREQLRRQIDEL